MRHRNRPDLADVGQRGARNRHEVHVDVEQNLTLDQEIKLERKRVERDVDSALNRVLDGNKAVVDLAPVDRTQNFIDRLDRHQLCGGQIGLAQQRLFRERTVGTKKADPGVGIDRAVGDLRLSHRREDRAQRGLTPPPIR